MAAEAMQQRSLGRPALSYGASEWSWTPATSTASDWVLVPCLEHSQVGPLRLQQDVHGVELAPLPVAKAYLHQAVQERGSA